MNQPSRPLVALLSANPSDANPYVALLQAGLAGVGVEAILCSDAGSDGVPDAARRCDIIHLHWLELWGPSTYRTLQHLGGQGVVGRGARRWLEPALNTRPLRDQRRQRFLDRFFSALEAYKAQGGRLVYTLHNWSQHEGEGERVERAALDRLLHLVDAVHVHAAYLTPQVQARLPRGVSPGVAVIPHGNYIDAYPNVLRPGDARRMLSLPDDAFVYLFFGLLRPYKGLEELLPAFSGLDHPDARLLIAGQSRPRDFAAQVASRSSDPRVQWRPQFIPPDEVQSWMNAADVVVLPYRHITTSGAALLAWSFGKPIIAPALPAFAEPMAGAPFLGLLYDPGQPDALAGALRQALASDWRSQQPAIMAWAKQFDWSIIGQRFAELYQQVLVGSPPPVAPVTSVHRA